MKNGFIKKADIFLAVFFAVLTILGFILTLGGSDKSAQVQISINGSVYKTLPLNKDAEIVIDNEYGMNEIMVQNGKVCVDDADCSGKDCIHFGWIGKEGQVIMCLPHRLLITIVKGGEIDAVVY